MLTQIKKEIKFREKLAEEAQLKMEFVCCCENIGGASLGFLLDFNYQNKKLRPFFAIYLLCWHIQIGWLF